MKLIRDKIHQSTFFDGKIRIADPIEIPLLLEMKLLEEVGEYLASGDPTELVDVLEVVYALAAEAGIDREVLEMQRLAKLEVSGGFEKGIVLL